MAQRFKVLHTQAGPFRQGDVITADDVAKAGKGYSLDKWLAHGAVEKLDEPAAEPSVGKKNK